MLSQQISADSVAGHERGVKVSCPPPALARLRDEAHRDSTSPCPMCLIALQLGGRCQAETCPGALLCSPQRSFRRQNVFKHSEVLFGCLYVVGEWLSTSLPSLMLEELLVSPALHRLSE